MLYNDTKHAFVGRHIAGGTRLEGGFDFWFATMALHMGGSADLFPAIGFSRPLQLSWLSFFLFCFFFATVAGVNRLHCIIWRQPLAHSHLLGGRMFRPLVSDSHALADWRCDASEADHGLHGHMIASDSRGVQRSTNKHTFHLASKSDRASWIILRPLPTRRRPPPRTLLGIRGHAGAHGMVDEWRRHCSHGLFRIFTFGSTVTSHHIFSARHRSGGRGSKV